VQLVELGRLNWKKIATSNGATIGELQGGIVDTNRLQVTHVNIGLNDEALKEFGLKKPFFGRVLISLPVNMIKSFNSKVELNKSLQELKESKECQEFSGKYPAQTPCRTFAKETRGQKLHLRLYEDFYKQPHCQRFSMAAPMQSMNEYEMVQHRKDPLRMMGSGCGLPINSVSVVNDLSSFCFWFHVQM
jgi:hypothetical protein